MPKGTCPDCDAEVQIEVGDNLHDIVTCDECNSELEIVGLDPVELDILDEDSEQEDDEDEY